MSQFKAGGVDSSVEETTMHFSSQLSLVEVVAVRLQKL